MLFFLFRLVPENLSLAKNFSLTKSTKSRKGQFSKIVSCDWLISVHLAIFFFFFQDSFVVIVFMIYSCIAL